MALGGLREDVGNGIWPKGIDYDCITSIKELGSAKYYINILHEKRTLIKIACEEIKMVRKLIETNIHKYATIIENAGEIDIYSLDQACADIDKTVGYIRKIVCKIPSIVEKQTKRYKINEKIKEKIRGSIPIF